MSQGVEDGYRVDALVGQDLQIIMNLFLRRKMLSRGIWLTICLALVMLVGAVSVVGCSGGSTPVTQVNPTHQVNTSGGVWLTIQ
jgi:hypothetical protein